MAEDETEKERSEGVNQGKDDAGVLGGRLSDYAAKLCRKKRKRLGLS